MQPLWLKRLAIGASGLALLGGGAVAMAATQHDSAGTARGAYLDDVAKHLNVTPGALTAAMEAARDEQIQAAVAAGRITQTQADALQQRTSQSGGAPLPRLGLGRAGVAERAVAARYLGLSAATLRSERRAGKSLAQIASATPGRSTAGLRAALLAADRARTEHAATSGLITPKQEQRRLARLEHTVEAQLRRTAVAKTHR